MEEGGAGQRAFLYSEPGSSSTAAVAGCSVQYSAVASCSIIHCIARESYADKKESHQVAVSFDHLFVLNIVMVT